MSRRKNRTRTFNRNAYWQGPPVHNANRAWLKNHRRKEVI